MEIISSFVQTYALIFCILILIFFGYDILLRSIVLTIWKIPISIDRIFSVIIGPFDMKVTIYHPLALRRRNVSNIVTHAVFIPSRCIINVVRCGRLKTH